MQATIVKNDNFETIGFQVKDNDGNSIFLWGIIPASEYYVKTVTHRELEIVVADLLKMQGKWYAFKNFHSRFYQVLYDTDGANALLDYNMKSIEDEIKQIEKDMVYCIESLIKLK